MHDINIRPFSPPGTAPTWTRPRPFRITHVDLEISIDLAERVVAGEVTHQVEFMPHSGTLRVVELDQHELEINAVEISGMPVAFGRSPGRLVIEVPVDAGVSFPVRISFTARQPAKGMYFIASDARMGRVAMAWTQGAMEDHSHWLPCFDSPNNLSTYRIGLRHRSGLLAVANGLCVQREELGDGWSRTVYEQRKPHVIYLLNIAVGDFVAVRDDGASVPLTHVLPRGSEHCASMMFRSTPFAISWLADYIRMPFAWPCYGHVVVHGFMWGGMENATLTTITDRGLVDESVAAAEDVDIDSLIIHELVHQWFGDLLTMKSWSDIWLNESFATYLEARCTAAWRVRSRSTRYADELALELWENFQVYLEEDSGRYRRPLVTNRYVDAYELFDRVAYEKGSLVLHALCRHLGEERFRAALALYAGRHAHDLVETADFRQAIEDATGEPLDWFFEQWIYRAGHPRIRVSWMHDPARRLLAVEIEQLQAAGDPEQVYRLATDIAWSVDGATMRKRIDIDRARTTMAYDCPTAPNWVVVDPEGDLPVEWLEVAELGELLARLRDAQLAAPARARAARSCGKLHPTLQLVGAISQVMAVEGLPELVLRQCIAALGSLRGEPARDALLRAWPGITQPRIRRSLAKALSAFRYDYVLAVSLAALAEAEPSLLTAGELWAARGAIECPGATPLLRAQLRRPSWNQRLRQAVLRGLGDSGEPAAIDEILHLLADATQPELVTAAALAGAAVIGARHLVARARIRRAIEPHLDADSLMVRSAAARALGQLMDTDAGAALSARLARESFGNVRRVFREALERLDGATAATTAVAALSKKIDELEQARRSFEAKLDAMEKRLREPPAKGASKTRPAKSKPRPAKARPRR
jgi:aminopeptidase N